MFLRRNGVQSGPHDVDEVAREHAAGRLGDAVMSWIPGEQRWISLGQRWSAPRRGARLIFGIAVAVLCAAGIVVTCQSKLALLPFALQIPSVLWAIVLVLSAVAVLGLGWAWQVVRRRGKTGLPVVFATVVVTCLVLWGLANASLVGRLLLFRQHASNASLSYDGEQRAIRLSGRLGPRLPEQLSMAFATHPDAGVLVLDSPGGLVDDALTAANLVHAKRLTTRVDGMCASACVAIWAAGRRREMTATSRLGLHQLHSGFDLPEAVTRVAMATLTRRYDAVLQRAGFADAVIEKARKTPPSAVYWLNPVEVKIAGVADSIVDGDGRSVSAPLAKWMWVAHSFGDDNPLGPWMRAIHAHAPAIALRHAHDLYADAEITRDRKAERDELNAVYREAQQFAFLRASDADTVAWARRQVAAFGGSRRFAWMCQVDTSDSAWTAISRDAARTTELHDLGQLLADVGPLDATHPQPTAYSATIERLSRHAWAATRHYGGGANASVWKHVDWCTYKQDFLDEALKLPEAEAAAAVRYVELKRWRLPAN